MFDTLIVFLKEFFEKVAFEKCLQTTLFNTSDSVPERNILNIMYMTRTHEPELRKIQANI